MKKTFVRPLLAAALACALVLPVQAEHYTGSEDWNVAFTGSEMVSNFKTSQMDEAISALQPGDTVQFTLSLRNSGSTTTDWYMTNKVLKSLEDSQSVADGGAYTYILTYTGPDGVTDTLYSSDAIGGDKVSSRDLEGLHEATDSLKDYFFLDELASGSSAQVDLSVALEGETQGNIYQDTLAALQMNFAVEPVTTTTIITNHPTPTPAPGTATATPSPAPESTPGSSGSGASGSGGVAATPRVRVVYLSRIPQTSDTAPIFAIAAICGISGLILLLLGILKLRKNKKR